jgi:hypothetical protein
MLGITQDTQIDQAGLGNVQKLKFEVEAMEMVISAMQVTTAVGDLFISCLFPINNRIKSRKRELPDRNVRQILLAILAKQ